MMFEEFVQVFIIGLLIFLLELGADIIKAAYPAEGPETKELFAAICKNAHVPVVMLGGAKKDSIPEIFQIARDGIDAGSKGVSLEETYGSGRPMRWKES